MMMMMIQMLVRRKQWLTVNNRKIDETDSFISPNELENDELNTKERNQGKAVEDVPVWETKTEAKSEVPPSGRSEEWKVAESLSIADKNKWKYRLDKEQIAWCVATTHLCYYQVAWLGNIKSR